VRSLRLVVCLALGTVLSGCITTKQAVSRIWGSENELLVRAVASVDKAWFVPGKGLVLAGRVTPGRLLGNPIRINPNDDPPTAPFLAALTLAELASRRPRLHYDRFHREWSDDESCIERFAGAAPLSVKEPQEIALRDPHDVSLWALRLESQEIHVKKLPGVGPVYPILLGPSGGDWLYTLAVPFTLVADGVRAVAAPIVDRIRGEPPAVSAPDKCGALESMLFPPVPTPPSRSATTWEWFTSVFYESE
jgi:hypothetical protein